MQSEAQPDKMIVVDVATEHRKDDKVLCISILTFVFRKRNDSYPYLNT